jgi:hypothetical protein
MVTVIPEHNINCCTSFGRVATEPSSVLGLQRVGDDILASALPSEIFHFYSVLRACTVIRGYFVPCSVDDAYMRFCCFYFRWACTDQVSHKIYTKKEDLHKGLNQNSTRYTRSLSCRQKSN